MVLNISIAEEVPETYWKELAEQRRQALDESLHENESVIWFNVFMFSAH